MITSKPSKRLTVLHVGTVNKPICSGSGYSPIETVIYNIDKGLHELGHRSIVACSADSLVTGEHFETVRTSLGDYCREKTPEGDTRIDRHLELTLERAMRGDIDVVHMHQWFERVYRGEFNPPVPIVLTLHVPGNDSGFAEFEGSEIAAVFPRPTVSAVAISDYQRGQYAGLLPVAATVPHGVDVSDYACDVQHNEDSFLLSIGRITEVKGQDTAIAVARRTGKQLILAGCVQDKPEDRDFYERLRPSIDLVVDLANEPVTSDYYERVMRPLLASGEQTIYVGELTSEATRYWYRYAEATLFPIRWGEPFGMVLIESMAAGTPVVAFRQGSVPEILRHGETGFIVDTLDEMIAAVGKVRELDRAASRRHVAANFSTRRMAESYAALYEQLVEPRRLQVTVSSNAGLQDTHTVKLPKAAAARSVVAISRSTPTRP